MSAAPLMPKATAVWLVENTSLTFEQIADFCKLHPLEVKGIADGEVAQGIKGHDPINSSQLTREMIAKAEASPDVKLTLAPSKVRLPEVKKTTRGPRYTPLSRRQDRPNAILWLVRNHPELKDAQIMRLAGTTKSTLQAIRERTHWNSAALSPLDPVTLGLCSQLELDLAVQKAASKGAKKVVGDAVAPRTLIPAHEISGTAAHAAAEAEKQKAAEAATPASSVRDDNKTYDADSVFAKLKGLKPEGAE